MNTPVSYTHLPKGVVHTHRSLIDRARAGADFDKLTSQEEVLAYLPPAWIGQNIFSYAQWLACGYVVNCPESAGTVMIDLKEIGPTYYFAPPRVFEGLLTSVMIRMEDAGALKRRLFHACMRLAQRVGPARMDGKPVGLGDSLLYALGNLRAVSYTHLILPHLHAHASHLPVDLDPAVGDPVVGLAAGAQAQLGHTFVQARPPVCSWR